MEENQTERLQKLQAFFAKDYFVELTGIELVEVTNERAVARAKIGKQHLNGNGCVQGGMLYTLADFTFAVLGNYLHPLTVTQGGHITYIRPAYTDEIIATATETERAGHNSISEVIIKDQQGQTVCVCNFNGFIKEGKR